MNSSASAYMQPHTGSNSSVNRPTNPRQVQNNAGGYVYNVSQEQRLLRFLILGTLGNDLYSNNKTATEKVLPELIEICAAMGTDYVDMVVEVSNEGRAPKNTEALYALAIAIASPELKIRRYAADRLRLVARTSTHLFDITQYVHSMRGMGRLWKKALRDWYLTKGQGDLEYQLVKYRQRNGFTHKKMLGLIRPQPKDESFNNLFAWATDKPYQNLGFPFITGYEAAKNNTDPEEVVQLIREYNLTQEMIPTEMLKSEMIWNELLNNINVMALVRNIKRLVILGFAGDTYCDRRIINLLSNSEAISKSRIHPFNIYNAIAAVRKMGGGISLMEALETALENSFKNVERTFASRMICIDVSGSMEWGNISNSAISYFEAAALTAFVSIKADPETKIYAFSNRLVEVQVTRNASFYSFIEVLRQINFGSTDPSLPLEHALRQRAYYDSIEIYTDSEANRGRNPAAVLKQYRDEINSYVKYIVCNVSNTPFSLADPQDVNALDVVGFDTATPQKISAFIKG